MQLLSRNTLSLWQLNRFTLLLLSLLCIGTTLTACGGGGGGGSPADAETAPPPPQENILTTGNLVPVIEGISFSTASESGTTGAQGQFTYRTGETIEFKLGGTILGEVKAAAKLSVFDLAGTPVITGTENLQAALSNSNPRNDDIGGTLTPPGINPWLPFQLAMNRLYLLHSLDRDQEPSNGVQIDPSIAELLSNVSFRFNQHWREFRDLLAIRKARVDGQAIGGFEGPLIQLSYPDILDAAYAAMGISPDIFNITKQFVGEELAIEYTYNDGDMLIRQTGWNPGEYRYDDRYNIIWSQNKCGYINETGYDATGNILSSTSGATRSAITTYKYDKYGSLVRREEDLDRDGYIDSYTAVKLNDQSQPVRIDEESNYGSPVILQLMDYDNQGNRVRWESHRNEHTSIQSQKFDAQNQLVWRQTINGPGIYSQQEWTYDTQGRVTTSTFSAYYNDRLTRNVYEIYNVRGDIVRNESDTDGNGSIDRVVTMIWDDDDNGKVRTTDTNADGIADEITRWEYEPRGSVAVTRVDENADGSWDTVTAAETRYATNEQGNTVLLDSSGSVVAEYDKNNNIVLYADRFYQVTMRFEYKQMGWKGVFFGRGPVSAYELFDYRPCL